MYGYAGYLHAALETVLALPPLLSLSFARARALSIPPSLSPYAHKRTAGERGLEKEPSKE